MEVGRAIKRGVGFPFAGSKQRHPLAATMDRGNIGRGSYPLLHTQFINEERLETAVIIRTNLNRTST